MIITFISCRSECIIAHDLSTSRMFSRRLAKCRINDRFRGCQISFRKNMLIQNKNDECKERTIFGFILNRPPRVPCSHKSVTMNAVRGPMSAVFSSMIKCLASGLIRSRHVVIIYDSHLPLKNATLFNANISPVDKLFTLLHNFQFIFPVECGFSKYLLVNVSKTSSINK